MPLSRPSLIVLISDSVTMYQAAAAGMRGVAADASRRHGGYRQEGRFRRQEGRFRAAHDHPRQVRDGPQLRTLVPGPGTLVPIRFTGISDRNIPGRP